MCGFVGIFGMTDTTVDWRTKALKMSAKIRHRGPDWSGVYASDKCVLAHERLAIVDPLSGGQPLYSQDGKKVLAVNGEIYNHIDIRNRYSGQYEFKTGSDCEVILALYEKKGIDFLEDLNGIYAFALYDSEKDAYLIARDPIGVIPLYIGRDKDGTVYVGSELKALEGFCDEYEPFLPGHYYWSRDGKMTSWYKRDWFEYDNVKDNAADVKQLREALIAARGGAGTAAGRQPGGQGFTAARWVGKGHLIWQRPRRWRTGSELSITKSTTQSRRVWMLSGM